MILQEHLRIIKTVFEVILSIFLKGLIHKTNPNLIVIVIAAKFNRQ
jgi:hypothetical protein